MESIIEIQNLNKTFGTKQVLKNLNLSIPNGGIFGIVGLNGAGKTTLIKCILALIPDFNGQVSINKLNSKTRAARQCVAYMPEKFSPNSNLTGTEYIKFYANLYNIPFDRKKSENLANEIQMPKNFLDLKIGQCSKGTIQKIGILACLYVEAKVIIMDEPTTGLDIISRHSLKTILQKYSQDRTIIFSSHILADVHALANNVAIISKGNTAFSGKPNNFIQRFNAQSFEEAFIMHEQS